MGHVTCISHGAGVPLAWQARPGAKVTKPDSAGVDAHLQYSLRDPEEFLKTHADILGQHANNIHHIGPEVGNQK